MTHLYGRCLEVHGEGEQTALEWTSETIIWDLVSLREAESLRSQHGS